LVSREKWPAFTPALKALHRPPSLADIAPQSPNRLRLAYDELFAGQLALLLMRARMKREAGAARVGDGNLVKAMLAALPFTLTDGQKQALSDIKRDLASPERMLRLLQGDVGSGKQLLPHGHDNGG